MGSIVNHVFYFLHRRSNRHQCLFNTPEATFHCSYLCFYPPFQCSPQYAMVEAPRAPLQITAPPVYRFLFSLAMLDLISALCICFHCFPPVLLKSRINRKCTKHLLNLPYTQHKQPTPKARQFTLRPQLLCMLKLPHPSTRKARLFTLRQQLRCMPKLPHLSTRKARQFTLNCRHPHTAHIPPRTHHSPFTRQSPKCTPTSSQVHP